MPIVLKCSKLSKIPQNLVSLGDHLKKKRLEQSLTQHELAQLLGADETTVYKWEKNRTKPKVYCLPKITNFLGYQPVEFQTESFGEMIISYRKRHGLSQRKFAALLDVDQSTVRDWERNRHRPSKRMISIISKILMDG